MAGDPRSASSMQQLCERLRKLPTAVISDVLYEMGLPDQVLASAIHPLDPRSRMVGPALTLNGEIGAQPDMPAGVSAPVYEMDRRLAPGQVVVMASGGFRATALIGGNVGLSFKLGGCVGVLTDGGIRDADEFLDIGLPLFHDFATPLSNKGRWHFSALDVPVQLAGQTSIGVIVRPGDVIHGDADGVLVIPQQHVALVADYSEEVERREGKIKEGIRAGEDREAVYQRADRFAHITKLGPGGKPG